ncbi:GNAT family N-acetyltransferase [Deinococcus sp. PESE-13]
MNTSRPPLNIRPAQPADAAFVAPLIQEAIGAVGHHLTATQSDEAAAPVIAEFFVQPGNRLSYANVLIAELGAQPVGLALTYLGEEADDLDAPLREHRRRQQLSPDITRETEGDELYLDTLSTTAAARGQGIGAALIDACAQRAQSLGVPLTLLVEDGNPARRLYERSGFVPAGRRELAGHGYTRMERRG